MPIALFTVSSNSSFSLESKTMPPPACTEATPSCMMIVRIVIAVSMLPPKPK